MQTTNVLLRTKKSLTSHVSIVWHAVPLVAKTRVDLRNFDLMFSVTIPACRTINDLCCDLDLTSIEDSCAVKTLYVCTMGKAWERAFTLCILLIYQLSNVSHPSRGFHMYILCLQGRDKERLYLGVFPITFSTYHLLPLHLQKVANVQF